MNQDFLALIPKTRFNEILSLSIKELKNLHKEGNLIQEEVELFLYNDFYFMYAQNRYRENNFTSNKILPLGYSNWRDVVLNLEHERSMSSVLQPLPLSEYIQDSAYGLSSFSPPDEYQSLPESPPLSDPSPPPSARLIYDVRIRWNWYYITIGALTAIFRLHQDEDMCWNLIKLFSKEQKFRDPGSSSGYEDSGKFHTDPGSYFRNFRKLEIAYGVSPNDFKWLAEFLRQGVSGSSKNHPFHYFGVEFFCDPSITPSNCYD